MVFELLTRTVELNDKKFLVNINVVGIGVSLFNINLWGNVDLTMNCKPRT